MLSCVRFFCDRTDYSPTGFSVHGISQARVLEWVAISYSMGAEFSLLWSFLTVCGFVQVANQGFLVKEACVGVLVGGAGFLLSGVQGSVQ